ncbi:MULTISPECIES: cyclic pyranopterin monophosphate synthase MoaC [Pirellulaceae]|uniref:Cyclic pyranopterin monophosphate synthase n=1 Tax=Aporhodopirellula rubra TaxID=980271 RepID=A0A7W5H676_9BACT|nr:MULTISPECIES: cyclic pyranopterin monophosphate synthase MoaC [Pirellulaceae]EMI45243.1 molybdenum cofactor biosynthesis protein C [Rhodopirellula sp. SWK7]MBB3207159.1 cyclic pyranopterin phosphate synthase [Aporhodopirellula rubra]
MSQSDSVGSTHFDDAGQAHMVDITAKPVTARVAVASSMIRMNPEAAELVRTGTGRKGDVLSVARLAAIGATKWTSTLIPLCHAIPIEGVSVDFQWGPLDESPAIDPADGASETLRCVATVRTTYKTGVEMEAMTAASVATLTVYDMLKSVDRTMVIVETKLESKAGGRSGVFSRQ